MTEAFIILRSLLNRSAQLMYEFTRLSRDVLSEQNLQRVLRLIKKVCLWKTFCIAIFISRAFSTSIGELDAHLLKKASFCFCFGTIYKPNGQVSNTSWKWKIFGVITKFWNSMHEFDFLFPYIKG